MQSRSFPFQLVRENGNLAQIIGNRLSDISEMVLYEGFVAHRMGGGQRSEPTTPISSSSRLPYEYDEVMGITQVDPREAEGFDEGLDLEYHDASENPSVPEPSDSMPKSVLSHGCCGSSSLRECIELLNNTERNAPATLHSSLGSRRRKHPTRNRL